MVHLIALLQAPQDRDRVLDARLVDHHGHEAPLQRGVLLDVLAVLVKSGGPDAVQFTAGKHRLEHVAGVHGALGFAGSDHGVKFVDKDDDTAFRLGDFVEDGLEAFLEFTAELGAGNQGAQVERDDPLLLEALGDVAGDDAQGESFDDGGLADARFTNQNGIVLGAAGKHLDGATNLGVASDDGVEFVLRGELGEVAAVFLQGLIAVFRIGAGHALVAANLGEGFQEVVMPDAEFIENADDRGVAGFFEHGKDEVLDGHVFVLELLGFVLRGDQQLVHALGDIALLTGAAG